MRPGGEGVDRGALAIRPVTAERLPAVLALRVAPGQEGFIETTAQCLAEAAEEPTWRPVALCDGGQVVGFAMYGRFRNRRRVWLDRLLIDRAYQGRGYGRAFWGCCWSGSLRSTGATASTLACLTTTGRPLPSTSPLALCPRASGTPGAKR